MKLLSTLIAAVFALVTFSAVAADAAAPAAAPAATGAAASDAAAFHPILRIKTQNLKSAWHGLETQSHGSSRYQAKLQISSACPPAIQSTC